jgi:glucan phosphoethanolaminetransferase (alkaline phosphatase superfamily)
MVPGTNNSHGGANMRSYQNIILKSFIVLMGGLIAGLCIFWLPRLAMDTALNNPDYAYLRFPVLIYMIASTAPFYFALFKANQLLNLIHRKAAFTNESVRALKEISICGALIALAYLVLSVILSLLGAMHPGILIAFAVLILTSITISFFANLLKILLEEALDYKNDVDLTI